MKQDYIIGVDIGGTNTDAVLIDHEERILSAIKTTTTEDISHGFKTALCQLLKKAEIPTDSIAAICVGTTHATNALLQKKDLFTVGVIRIAGHYPHMLPSGYSWPKELKQTLLRGTETISGGFECHLGPLTPLCREEARLAIDKLLKMGVESIAIIGVFSPLNGYQEQEVAHVVHEMAGSDFPVSLSYEIGGIGFIERENSTILNAALKHVMRQGFHSLKIVAQELGIPCPLMITQNDGSLIDIAHAIKYPVLTISAGPTNSFIGGARLSGKDSAVIVDMGGTSTDVGLVRKGFPIRSLNTSNIGGVALNFPMPDVLSIALGGGSVVIIEGEEITIGPQSMAKALSTEALAFGGHQLTLTDVALFLGHLKIPEANVHSIAMSQKTANQVFEQVREKIWQLVFRMQGESNDLPVICVGGGSALLPASLFDSHYHIPCHFDVANAYGAALAEIAGTVDVVVSLQKREEVLEELYKKARHKAIDQGANPATLRLVDQQIIPYSYAPNQMARVVIRYSGKKMFNQEKKTL